MQKCPRDPGTRNIIAREWKGTIDEGRRGTKAAAGRAVMTAVFLGLRPEWWILWSESTAADDSPSLNALMMWSAAGERKDYSTCPGWGKCSEMRVISDYLPTLSLSSLPDDLRSRNEKPDKLLVVSASLMG